MRLNATALPFTLAFLALVFTGCNPRQKVDLLVHNARIYTVDSAFSQATAFAVKDGRFVSVGQSENLLEAYTADTTINANGGFIYPGLIDAHCHFHGYGLSLQQVNLTGTNSFAEVVAAATRHRLLYPSQTWLTGRGWDQNDWLVKEFPTRDTLDLLFPDLPVLLRRIDGHGALANRKALELAGITPATKIAGGFVEVKNGQLTGILLDNAVDKVLEKVPAPTRQDQISALLQAQKNCFAVGLTTVSDAGLDKQVVLLIDSLQKAGVLTMRVYAMLNPSAENLHYFTKPIATDNLSVRSFKVYADGALGSRGACLIKPYSDQPHNHGFLVTSRPELTRLAQHIARSDFQMNTHCIGDSANRLLLQLYAQVLEPGNKRRWRIEHAQVVSPTDVPQFGRYGIIPSVQPTHATSDMYWAEDRLGKERVATAYAYRDLWAQNKIAAFGSDFPIEDINPLFGFHAAVARQDAKSFPPQGYQMQNALSREQALRGTTWYAAFANFEEKQKGSIEKGKLADFVLLDQDLMKVPFSQLRKTKVLQTWVGGKLVHKQ